MDHLRRPAAGQSGVLQGGIDHPSAKLYPLNNAGRQLAMYDPKTKQITHISTCFSTHHLMFAEDANNTLWTSGGGQVVGWLNTKMFDETHDEAKSQGWTALVIDTNGNGKRDAYVEPGPAGRSGQGQALRRCVLLRRARAGRLHLGLGARLPRRCGAAGAWHESAGNRSRRGVRAAVRQPAPRSGFSPRGRDIDRNGVVWAALASGHLASFDRRKCKGPLNGPKATGQHCPEGWTLYAEPLPQLKGVTDPGSAEASYYTWVDQFDTFGLGDNTPINTGNASEGLLALKNGKWVVLRVPYPIGLLHEVDGRPDRRSEGRMEGTRPLFDRQHPSAVPHGDRQGDDQQGDPLPAAPGSAGQVSREVRLRSLILIPDP